MSGLVQPHGGQSLKPLLVPVTQRADDLAHAETLKKVPMTSRETSDVLMFGMGAYTPLDGFMNQADWHGVSEHMKTENGLFWPIPITLSADTALADSIEEGEEVALTDGASGEVLAVMEVTEKYSPDKTFECTHVFRTDDEAHPGVAKVMEQGAVNLAGRVEVLSESTFPEMYGALYKHPAEARALFDELGWSRVAAFQTRNPMHRSHEHLVKTAIEVTDGVFVHQVLGALKPGDIPADVRVRAIDALIERYFVPGTVVQAGYPIEMRYAGPREALLHAVLRQNFGCSHLIVGRDHAGVGDYYGPFDAQHIFDTLWDGALETRPLKLDVTFYCYRTQGMASARTSPAGPDERLSISGTQLREMLSKGEDVPVEFSRPEVVKILREFYASQK